MSKDQISMPCSLSNSELETVPPGTFASAVARASASEILAWAASLACVAGSAIANEALRAMIDAKAINEILGVVMVDDLRIQCGVFALERISHMYERRLTTLLRREDEKPALRAAFYLLEYS